MHTVKLVSTYRIVQHSHVIIWLVTNFNDLSSLFEYYDLQIHVCFLSHFVRMLGFTIHVTNPSQSCNIVLWQLVEDINAVFCCSCWSLPRHSEVLFDLPTIWRCAGNWSFDRLLFYHSDHTFRNTAIQWPCTWKYFSTIVVTMHLSSWVDRQPAREPTGCYCLSSLALTARCKYMHELYIAWLGCSSFRKVTQPMFLIKN